MGAESTICSTNLDNTDSSATLRKRARRRSPMQLTEALRKPVELWVLASDRPEPLPLRARMVERLDRCRPDARVATVPHSEDWLIVKAQMAIVQLDEALRAAKSHTVMHAPASSSGLPALRSMRNVVTACRERVLETLAGTRDTMVRESLAGDVDLFTAIDETLCRLDLLLRQKAAWDRRMAMLSQHDALASAESKKLAA